jgi:uncharacterized protein YecE (DUF72 family)
LSGAIRIGVSGWRYPGWRGVFYPPHLPQRAELAYASRAFASIEINGSFYSLQRPASWARWEAETPADFLFSVKGSRYITHFLRLHAARNALANFFASGVLALREKLGPILWQLPPTLAYDADRLEQFLSLLPADTHAAAALARRHDARIRGRVHVAVDAARPIRHAIEIRHESFLVTAFVEQLRRHGVALVVADTARRWPFVEDVTADFVYVRLHGDEEIYASGYGDAALDRWARRLRAWRVGREPVDAQRIAGATRDARPRDVYCYFDNDAKVRAPFDALGLAKRLRVASGFSREAATAFADSASGRIGRSRAAASSRGSRRSGQAPRHPAGTSRRPARGSRPRKHRRFRAGS